MTAWSTSIDERFRWLARQQPTQPALIIAGPEQPRQVLTYAELDELSRPPRDAGPSPGFLLRCHPDLETASSIVAGIRAGRLVALLDRSNKGISDHEASELLTQLSGRSLLGRPGSEVDPPAEDVGGVALFTGGTTGQPALIHRRAWPRWSARRDSPLLYRQTGWRPGQTQLLIGAWAHAAPLTHLVEGLLCGNTLITPTVFEPELVFSLLERHRVEWAQVSPTHLQILHAGLSSRQAAITHLRGVVHTGGPCAPSTRRQWIGAIGSHRLWEVYAASEGIGYTLCRASEWLDRPDTVGRGFMTRIRVLDESGHPLPAESVGTVYMKALGSDSSTVSSRPAVTHDGFRTVGDRGRLDSEGYLYLEGRTDDMVTVGGENVYTGHVTRVLMDYPTILDAAVVPLSDPIFGTRLVGLVVGPITTSRSDIVRHCLRRLAPHEIPHIALVESLERTEAGKTRPEALLRLAKGVTA